MKQAEILFCCAWLVSLIGVFSSLFYGEVLGHFPCALCWYQRIVLFPLSYFLGFALYRSDWSIRLYALPWTALGLMIALLQQLKELFPRLLSTPCSLDTPCSQAAPLLWGVLSFPLASALGFGLIFLLLLLSKK